MVIITNDHRSPSLHRGLKRSINIVEDGLLEINGELYSPDNAIGGEGKNGKVSVLKHIRTSKKVVLKTFKNVSEARNEVRMLKRVTGVNHVARLADHSQWLDQSSSENKRQRLESTAVVDANLAEKPFVLLDYAENGDLLDFINLVIYKMKRTFNEDLIKNLTVQMLSALSSIHSLGIVHKDVKCENFLMYDHYRSLCLSDFGDAIESCDRVNLPPSEGYIAPSILYGDDNVVPKALDIWPIAVIVLMLFTGKAPFDIKSSPSGNIELIRAGNMAEFWSRLEASSPRVRVMSVEMKSFLTSILVNNDNDRPTADQLLASPWLSGATNTNTNKLN